MVKDHDVPSKIIRLRAHGVRAQFLIDAPFDHIQAAIAKSKRFYEEDLLDELFHRALPGMRFVDVGANIGNHSVFLSLVAGLQGVAIEPYLPNYTRLLANLELNGVIGQVRTENIALGRKSGRLNLAEIRENNTGTAKFVPDSEGSTEMIPLSRLNVGAFHILKVDVEGMELEVLKGAAKPIKAYRPIIICEAHSPERFSQICAFLEPMGYWPTRRYCVTPTYLFEPR